MLLQCRDNRVRRWDFRAGRVLDCPGARAVFEQDVLSGVVGEAGLQVQPMALGKGTVDASAVTQVTGIPGINSTWG